MLSERDFAVAFRSLALLRYSVAILPSDVATDLRLSWSFSSLTCSAKLRSWLATSSISLARDSSADAALLSWVTVTSTCWFAASNAFASSVDTLSNEPALPSIAVLMASLAALSASSESLTPFFACSISCFVDSSTVPVCLSIPPADVSESDVELKTPASDVALV